MSIDGRGSSPSRASQDRISALASERDRLKRQLAERTEERDRARSIAVALEQELAESGGGDERG